MKKFDLQIPRIQYSRFRIGVLVALLLLIVGCQETTNWEVEHSFSNLAIDGDTLWFGAGYKLYRVDINRQTASLVYDTNDVQISFVLVDGKRLYFGGSSDKKNVVWSLDLDSEKILWTHNFSRSRGFFIGSSGFSTIPLVTHELLLIGETDQLYALDKRSGDLKGQIKNNRFDSLVLTPILANDRLIYGAYKIGERGPEANNTIAIADPLSGQTIRTITMLGYLGGIPAVHGDCFIVKEDLDSNPTGINLTGAHILRLNCMDFHSGEVLWSIEGIGYLGRSQISFHNGLILDVFGDQLFAINEQSGAILWKSQELDHDYTFENPRVIENLAWIAIESSDFSKVIYLELMTGKLRDEELADLLSSPIFIDQEAIYGTTNALVRVDIVTGDIIWSIPVESHYLARQYKKD